MARSQILPAALLAALCILTGAAVAGYVALIEGNLLLVAALPFAALLFCLLVTDKRKLFLLILLFRASADVVFTKSSFDGGMGVGALVNLLVIFIALLYLAEANGPMLKLTLSAWGSLLLVSMAGVLKAPELVSAARFWLTLLSYCAVFAIALHIVRSDRDFERIVDVIILSSLPPAVTALAEIALNAGSLGGFRLKATFMHPNILAFYLVVVITLLFYRLKSDARLPEAMRLAMWSYLGLLLAFLVFTQTRSAWAGCLVVFAVYAVFHERRWLLYLLLAPALAFLVPGVRDRLLDLASGNVHADYAKLNSFAWRVLLWQNAVEWMRPLEAVFGLGLKSFSHYSPRFFALSAGISFNAHSAYVQWFFETGALGVACAAWLYYRVLSVLKAGFHANRLRGLLMITLAIEYLVVSFSDNMLDYLSLDWYFWGVMGAACAVSIAPAREVIFRRYAHASV